MRIFLTGLTLIACLLTACTDDDSADCQPGEQARTGDAWVETADAVVDTAVTSDVSDSETSLDTTDVVATVDTTEPEVDTAAESDPDPDRSEP
jgi:hypothetical protein